MSSYCARGCGRLAVHAHHIVRRQEIRRYGAPELVEVLIADERNLMPLCEEHHAAHHSRSNVIPLALVPDGAVDFAVRLMGAGRAFEFLSRFYAHDGRREDDRLVRLLLEWEEAA